MATISVPSSIQGKTYSVKIAGDTPTPEEQARISAFVAQQDAQLSKFMPGAQKEAAPEEKGGIGTALGVGVDMLQQAYGSALEGAGSSLGLQSLRDYGRSVSDFNSQQIQEATPGLTGYEDVSGIGSGLKYFGETLAKQVPQLGVSLAGAGAGALAGSAVPFIGTGIGAIAGGALANMPFFYGSNRERQKEADVAAGRPVQVDEGTAFLSAIPQATIDAIVDKMLVGKLLKPAMIGSGNILLRTVKGAGAGIAAEVPSEIGQQMIERYQAGLPLDDDEALAEYAAVARETAIVGGTVGSVSNVAGGDSRVREQKKKDEEAARQIEEDQAEDAKDIMDKIGFGQKAMEPPVEEEAPPTIAGLLPPPTIGSPAPTAPPAAGAAPSAPAATPPTAAGPVTAVTTYTYNTPQGPKTTITLSNLQTITIDGTYSETSDAVLDAVSQYNASAPSAPAATPPAPKTSSGIQLDGVDEAIASGVSNLKVSEDGKEVPFKTFALSVDGDRAEVGFVEKQQGARRGIGRDAYVALGNDLSGRGITLQSTETLLKDGNALWKGLEKSGNATYNASTKRFEFKPNAAPQAAPTAPTFMWKQYQAVLQNIGKEKAPTVLAIQNAAKAAGTPVTPAVARDIRSQMERDGVVKPSAKAKGGYEYQPNVVPQVDRAESYRRTLQDLTREAADARTAREKAVLDARKAQQTGKAADARKLMLEVDKADQTLAGIERNMQEVSSRLPNVQQEQAVPTTQQPGSRMEGRQTFAPITEAPPAVQSKAVTARSQRLRQAMSYYQDQARRQGIELRRLQSDQKKVQLPKSDIKRMEDLKASISQATQNVQQIGRRLANPTADIQENVAQQKADVAKQAAAVAERADKTPIYSQKEGQIFTALRKRLDNLGLKDVQLVAEKMLKPEAAKQDALYEGLFDVKDGNRMIAVSMGIYDPKLTPQQQFDALAEVMNHEVIHAMRNLGLFTDGEWKVLSDLAARQQFMKMKNGKLTQRGYTYLQRAKQMYAQDSAEIQVEEAVAEMFRDYTAGRLKIGGRPKTLMERIKSFFTSIWKSHEDAGMTDPNQIFEGVRFGEIGNRERKVENRASPVSPNADTEQIKSVFARGSDGKDDMRRYSMLTVPEGTRAHKLPDILLSKGDGSEPTQPITQSYSPSNILRNNTAIDAALAEHPDSLRSEAGWAGLMQATFGGEYLPKAPFVAINYASDPNAIAQKLKSLTPSLKDGVDRGFKHVQALRNLYTSGQATPDMTADLFIWGILSRGAGPVQQEGAYIDVIDSAKPFVDKAIAGPLSDSDVDLWKVQVTGALKEASPGRQVTMNVNAAGRLIQAMSQLAPNSDKTILQTVHDMMSDSNISGPEIRRWFLSNTESAGIDNKVVSFILLVGGRDDVLVMDRIQSRHLWDDGRFGGANIYDGVGADGGGLSQIMKGPRGLLITEALENGLKDSVITAYDMIGRPQDGSIGRFHWESWVIDGEQVVDHSTLAAVASRTPVGYSVTEGKMATFSSGSRYIRTKNGSIMEYPLSDGSVVYMKPTTFKDFLDAIKSGKITDESGKSVKIDRPVIPKGFKITARADIPWYERPEIDRSALDALARRFEDAESEGKIYGRNAGGGAGTAASGGGRSGSAAQRLSVRAAGDGRGREAVRGLAPLEGAPQVRGASGPDMRLVRVAEDYARSIGIDLRRQAYYAKVNPELAARIAEAYEAMPHDPRDPKVKEAFQNLIEQTTAQYRALQDAGYKFWFMDPENVGEYGSSPWNAMRDLRANQSMGVYPTTGGFGTNEEADISGNPMLAETGIMWPWGSPDGTKVPVLANDLFRAVHDAFGHGLEGAGFRADGEENAWQAHIRLFTGSAKGAITSETRGQNSWLNYGPFGEKNRNAKVEDTVFADQKTGLMPEWTWQEGRVPDAEAYPTERASVRYSTSAITPSVGRKVQTNQKTLMYARASDLIAKVLNLKGYGIELTKAREFSDGVLRRFQDSMLPVGRMIQELSQRGMTITDAMDPYLQEELMHGVVGQKIAQNQTTMFEPIMEAVKSLNVPQARIDALVRDTNLASTSGRGFLGLALESYGSPKLALAEAYLYAKHSRERNKFIRENRDEESDTGSGMSDDEAMTILRWFEGLDGPNKDVVKKMGLAVRDVVANTNATRLDGGLISADVVRTDGTAPVEGADYRFYVPLRGSIGEETDDEFAGPPGTPRFGARGREDRKALGRSDYASDILANLFTQNQNAILRAERNKVGQSFLKLLRANTKETGAYARVLPKAPTIRSEGDGKPVMKANPRAAERPDILVVKEDGREVFVQFNDERLAGALNGKNGMSPMNANFLTQSMQKVNRYLASINTSYNPEFFITNMLRDLQTAGVNVNQYDQEGITKDVLGGLKGALVGIKRVIRNEDDTTEWSKVYKDFMASGGQNSTNQFNSLAEEMSNIQTLLGDISESGARGQWAKVKNSFIGQKTGSLLKMVEDYNTIVENGIRVATYKSLLDRGFTKQRAAQAARNVTVNFAKGGDYRQAMGAWYLFYNASLQGSFALLNAAIRSPKVRKLWASVIVMGLVQDQLNALLSDDDDDGDKVYDKIPDYVLEHNFVLPDPFGFTDRSYISIPMPYGLNMAHNAGRAISRAMRGGYDAGEATSTIFGTAIDTLNPIGGFESWANFFAPTVADPFIDVIENRDFADKPIFKESLPFDKTPAPDSQQYWSTTSPSAVWLANTMNDLTGGNDVRPGLIDWSPDMMEFWFDYLTGGVGRFVQRSAELPFTVAGEGISEELVREIPFVRRTIGSVSDREDMGAYIEGAKNVLMAGEELKKAREAGDVQWARDTIQNYGKELRLLGPIKAMDGALRKVSMQRNQIMANERIPEDQRRLLLDRLDERKQMILLRANILLKQLE